MVRWLSKVSSMAGDPAKWDPRVVRPRGVPTFDGHLTIQSHFFWKKIHEKSSRVRKDLEFGILVESYVDSRSQNVCSLFSFATAPGM